MRRPIVLLVAILSISAMLMAGAATVSGHQAELAAVRRATIKFFWLQKALDAGYGVFSVCTDEPGKGAMGQHYVNGSLVGDAIVDPEAPEALMYEPTKHGGLRFVGVEWVVFKQAWLDAGHSASNPPKLFGRTFTLVPEPNRYGIPTFYQLHGWAWKWNPTGAFKDWNPRVSCRHARDD